PEGVGGQEWSGRVLILGRLLRILVLRRERVPLGHLEAAELRPRRRVLVLLREIALQRDDRLGVVPLLLVRGGEVAVSLRGALQDLVLRVRDGGAAAAAEEAGVQLAQAAPAAGADADEDEADREDD